MSQFPNDNAVSSDFNVPGEPPAWPKVVGIISIVWGSLGAVCSVCGLAGSAIQGAFLGMVPPEQQEQMKAQMAAGQSPLVMLSHALALVLTIVLIVAGISTIKRKPIGRLLHLLYGGAGVLVVLLSTFASWSAIQAQMAAMASDPNLQQQAEAMKAGMMAGIVFGVCFGMAYPLFCLVWFGLMGKRPEAGAAPEEPLV